MLSEKEIRDITRKVVEQHLTAKNRAPVAGVQSSDRESVTGGQASGVEPSARAQRQGVEPSARTLPAGSGPEPAPEAKTLALGADHGGYELKEKLKPHLYDLGWAVDDCGAYSDAPVDYPALAMAVALKVSRGQVSRGIMIDGAGIGSCMAANKVRGVRAALCYDTVTARNSREHNDANVLTLGGRLIGITLAQEIVKTWLSTDCGEERHRKRVAMIMDIEQRFGGAAGAP